MSVLIVTPLYPSPEMPSAGIFIHRQVESLRALGLSCRVLLHRPGPPSWPRRLRRRAWLRHYWTLMRHGPCLPDAPFETAFYERQWVEEENVVPPITSALTRHLRNSVHPLPDVIYAHFLWPTAAASLEVARHLDRPLVAISRGGDVQEWLAARPLAKPQVLRVLREADRLLANCDRLRKTAEELMPGAAARTTVIYNGCDASRFRPPDDRVFARRALGLDPDRRVLLFCGSIEAVKGIDPLISAWARFSSSHPDWLLLLVGPLVERALARRLARGPAIRLMGPVAPLEVPRYFQAADAYVQPSLSEGLANATMEAMATALPVVSTNVGGQGELITDGVDGLLVAPDDAESLARALAWIADDDERALKVGRSARETIVRRFAHDAQAHRLAEILRTAADPALSQHEPSV